MYVYDVKFDVFTDHKALSILFIEGIEYEATMVAKYLNNYDITIQYHSDKVM